MSRVVVLAGDGVGPEVTEAAVEVMLAAANRAGLAIEISEALVGGAAVDATASPLPDATLEACRAADAALLGAVGGPKWASIPVPQRPEQGLLKLRKSLELFANLRPVKTLPCLVDASPLRPERLVNVDIMVVRELTGGLYFGKREKTADAAYDTCEYSLLEIERVLRAAGRIAGQRRGKVTSVDKANVLDTSRLWRETAERLFPAEFPQVELEHVLVDTAAMELIGRPARFDVMVTENMFGDILTDEASMLVGSMGLLPSASIGAGTFGLYEPIHGSAPDIAGQDIANPTGAILSAAMLLRQSLGADAPAAAIERAVEACLEDGVRTRDIAVPGTAPVGTRAFGRAVIERL